MVCSKGIPLHKTLFIPIWALDSYQTRGHETHNQQTHTHIYVYGHPSLTIYEYWHANIPGDGRTYTYSGKN